jgi:hypothetical protein
MCKKSLLAKAQRLRNSIGIRNESSLHQTLKHEYAGHQGKLEVKIGRFIADGINKDGEYIEVQTGSFAPLEKKIRKFASYGRVQIIHPIAVKKTIEVYEPRKIKPLYRRQSPVKGSLWKLFDALVYAPKIPLIRKVSIEVAMVDITEKRIKDGKGSWRRKGASIEDHTLDAWHECFLFKKPSDYLCFIPYEKGEEFTSSLLAEHTGIDQGTARKALYVLTKMKVIKRIGKKGKSWLYTR